MDEKATLLSPPCSSADRIVLAQERLPYKEGWRPVNLINGFSLAADILQLSLNTPEERADSAGIEDGFVTSHGAMF